MTTTMEKENDAAGASSHGVLLKLLVLFVFAFVEGFLLERSRIWVPQVLFDQFIFETWVVLKIFMGALGASLLIQAAMSKTHPKAFEKSRFYKIHNRGYVRTCVGTFLVGVGMALTGTGPTMIPVQISMWVENGFYVILGGLAGVLVFALLNSQWDLDGALRNPGVQVEEQDPPAKILPVHDNDKANSSSRRSSETPLVPRKQSLVIEDVISSYPYSTIAAALGCGCVCVGVGLEIGFPFDEELERYDQVLPNGKVLRIGGGWPPMLGGIAMGIAQLPLRLITRDGHGGSTLFHNWVSTLTFGVIPKTSQYVMNKMDNWWQTFYLWVGVPAGVLVAAAAYSEVGPSHDLVPGFDKWRTVVGGATMLFGARLAGGCTCGHGISGASELSIMSFIGAGCIFAGGIITAVLFRCEEDWC